MNDTVNNPRHYTAHPSGIECIQVAEHMGFNLGNALKYIWRCDLKQDAIEDLKKASWYIEREIARRETEAIKVASPHSQPMMETPAMEVTPEEDEAWSAVDFGSGVA